jgi:triacylglycerol esterase/lipase EstA (alpha/beta hydrolase family)
MPRALLALVLLLSAAAPAAAQERFAPPDRPGPALSVPRAELDKALGCSRQPLEGATRAPVLLVQGTGATAKDNWSWTYEPALTKRGIPWCHVDLPEQATQDVQRSGEFVVHAIRTMHARAGRRIALIGHSQGGMVPRWALRFWPDTRAMVDDLIGFAPSNHGTTEARDCTGGGCSAASTQQSDQSAFMQALNSAAETWKGISYTSVYTRIDQTVRPNDDAETGSSSLRTGEGRRTNVAIQDVCPVAKSEHLAIGTVDPIAYALAMDALAHDGPADPRRVPPTVCAEPFHEGINPATFATDVAAAVASFQGYRAKTVDREPPLACYALEAGCGTAATCTSRRRFAVRLPALRGARATLGGKRLTLRRSGGRLRAVVDLRGRPKGTVVLRVRGRDARGRAVTVVRRYRTCTPRS